jgi:hypothetical protein
MDVNSEKEREIARRGCDSQQDDVREFDGSGNIKDDNHRSQDHSSSDDENENFAKENCDAEENQHDSNTSDVSRDQSDLSSEACHFFKDPILETRPSGPSSLPQLYSKRPADPKIFKYDMEIFKLRPMSSALQLRYEMPDHTRWYNYMPLTRADSIRLVELFPGEGEFENDIHCRILHERLSNLPEYEGLSYTWGDPNDTQEIWCCGHRLSITKSLRTALRRLRYAEKPRKFWVDAICMYQDRYRSKCCRNLRFEPQFCEGVGFAHLACRIRKFTLRVFIMEIY